MKKPIKDSIYIKIREMIEIIFCADTKSIFDAKRINKICPPSSGATGNKLKIKRNRFSKAKKYKLSFIKILDMIKDKIKVIKLKMGPDIKTFKSSKKVVDDLF